ncbi:MAG: response regulator [Proteobacteria bacterium]|nr:response regulator [Pseudomonadota bacterium]
MLATLVGERYQLTVNATPVGAVFIDRVLLEQVILNLALNARDALGRTGSVTITTGTTNLTGGFGGGKGAVFVEVSDTGCGIAEEQAKRIFDPFFTTKDQGTGLGLFTAREIIERAGGRIGLRSSLGEGTAMRVILPLAAGAVTPDTTGPACSFSAPWAARILVVEDERTVATLVTKVLEQAGYKVETAASADDARAILRGRADEFDLVLSDVVMANVKTNPSLPVLLMSASPEVGLESGEQEGIAAGATPLLKKPFSIVLLTERVRHHLRSRPQLLSS